MKFAEKHLLFSGKIRFFVKSITRIIRLMKTTQEYLQLLSEYKQKRGLFYGISRICIFGSVARGEQTENSDVDVCVDLEVPSIFSLVHIKEELRQLFGCNVDVVRFRQNMDALLKHDILEEGIYV